MSVHNKSDSRSHQRASSNQTGNKSRDRIIAEKGTDWFELFWAKKRQELNINAFKYKTGDQLYAISKNMEQDFANFWRFRATVTMRLMTVHTRRRTRLLLYFAFQKYKV